MKYAKRGGVKVLVEPFADIHELVKASRKDDRLKVNLAVGFSDLIGQGIESLNDLADERILGDNIQCSLSDINYSVVGAVKGNSNQCSGIVIISVGADVSDVIEENLDAESAAREDGEDDEELADQGEG